MEVVIDEKNALPIIGVGFMTVIIACALYNWFLNGWVICRGLLA